MTSYSQKDPRWKYKTFSPANLSIGSYGCFLTSLACLIDKEPPEVARILDDHNCFDSQGYLDSACAAGTLGLEYNGKTTDIEEAINFLNT